MQVGFVSSVMGHFQKRTALAYLELILIDYNFHRFALGYCMNFGQIKSLWEALNINQGIFSLKRKSPDYSSTQIKNP